MYHRLTGSLCPPSGLVFFDLETTGLSGGAGTVAFLAAIGRVRGTVLELSQYFLADYPGEAAFVSAVCEELASAQALVTYNGLCFDWPLLRTRAILNGMRVPEALVHADLVYASRRLWRARLPDCSLSQVERSVLGFDRGPDLPGRDVPETWFRYLKSGYHDRLGLAMDHNLSDLVSLAGLAATLADSASGAEAPLADPVAMALLQHDYDPAHAEERLKALATAGNEKAIKALMRMYWNSGRKDDRLELAVFLPDDPRSLMLKSLYWERRAKDMDRALYYARAAVSSSCAQHLDALCVRAQARCDRLLKKT